MAGVALLLATLCANSTICNNTQPSNLVNVELRQKGTVLNENESFKIRNLENLARELKGKTLRVTTLEDFPLSYVTRDKNGKQIGNGTAFEFLEFLTKKFDFKYELVMPKYNILGSSNDTDGSLTQLVARNEVDIAVAFLPILADSRKHMLFSAALDEGEWKIIMTRPQESASGAGLLAPFHEIVWYLILVSLIVVGPVIYCLLVLYKYCTRDPEQQFYNLPKSVWFVYGALMKQGSTLSPTADSVRIIFATWWIYITILTSFYTANLTAFLTLSRFTLPINNPKDILNKRQGFISQRGFAIEYAIKNTDEELAYLKPLLDKSLATFTNQNNDTDILLNQVLKKNLVFIRDRPAIDHLVYEDYRGRKFLKTERLQCPFAMSKEISLKRKRGFAFPKNTKWNELFDPQLQYLVEAGIVKFKLNDGLPKAEICPQNLGSTERQLRLQDLFTTYLTMLAGFSTALVVFFTEMFFRYMNKRKSRMVRNNTENQTRRIMVQPSRKPKQAFVKEAKIISPPPAYGDAIKTIFTTGTTNIAGATAAVGSQPGQQVEAYKTFNGRTYAVVKDEGGTQLVPTRAPSAALFNYQYAYNSYN